MKQTCEMWIIGCEDYCTKEMSYRLYPFEMTGDDYVTVGTTVVEFEMPDGFDPRQKKIEVLQSKKAKVMADYQVGPLLLDAFQTAQPRIVRTDDNSATGRSSLLAMGWLLFVDNPLGYGFGFNPTEHWTKFWQELYTMDNPSVLKDTQLHNYVLNMLNTYGIGLLLVFLLTQILTGMLNFPVFVSPANMAMAILICIITGILAGFIPASQAAKMDPVVAIRSK